MTRFASATLLNYDDDNNDDPDCHFSPSADGGLLRSTRISPDPRPAPSAKSPARPSPAVPRRRYFVFTCDSFCRPRAENTNESCTPAYSICSLRRKRVITLYFITRIQGDSSGRDNARRVVVRVFSFPSPTTVRRCRVHVVACVEKSAKKKGELS